MTTKTKTPDLEALAAEAEAAEDAARQAQERAEEIKRTRDAAAAEYKERRRVLESEFWHEQQRTYRERCGGKIDAAWAAFVDTVRAGGDTVAAWRAYRTTRVTVAADFRAFARYIAEEEDRHHEATIEAEITEATWLYDRAHQLLQIPGPSAELAEFNRRRSAFEGKEYAPDAKPGAVPMPTLHRDRVGGISSHVGRQGPDPREGEKYAAAIDQAMKQLEAEALEQAETQRRADREAYIASQAPGVSARRRSA